MESKNNSQEKFKKYFELSENENTFLKFVGYGEIGAKPWANTLGQWGKNDGGKKTQIVNFILSVPWGI